MHSDDPSNKPNRKALADQADTRLAIAAFIARTKLDLTDAFGTMEQEVNGDPVIFDARSKKALDQYLGDLPPQIMPEQRRFLRDELEEDRGLMLNGLRTAALDQARTGHNQDLARVAERFAADVEVEARKLGFSGEVDGGFRAQAVLQGLGKAEMALFERTDLDDAQKQDFLARARSRSAEAAVSGTFEAHLAEGPDAAHALLEDFRSMEAPEGINKDAQETITRRLGGWLKDVRIKIAADQSQAETEAAIEQAQTVTELSVAIGNGTAGHRDIQSAALSPEQKARLAAEAEAQDAREQKRREDRARVARIVAGGADDTDALDPDNPDHRAAVDDYFETVVLPNRGRVIGAASFIAATGMVPEAAETILTKGLIGPPDLGGEPRRGASSATQAAAAGLLARIDGLAPDALDGIDPRIRARAETINKYIRSGMLPEQAAQRADELVADQLAEAEGLEGGAGDEALQGGDDGELQAAQRPPNDGNFIASDEDKDFDDDGTDAATDPNDGEIIDGDGVQLAHAPGPASPKQKVPSNTQSPVPNPKMRNDSNAKGHFGAPRTHGPHQGVDLLAAPGTAVQSPVDGTIEHVGDPYKPTHPLHQQYNSIWIRDKNGTRIKLFYVAPTDATGKRLIKPGDRVKVGQQIGTMQDRASADKSKKMKNHVHVEVWPQPGSKTVRQVDPAPWLKAWGVK